MNMGTKKNYHDCKDCEHSFPQFGVYHCLHRCYKNEGDYVIFFEHKITDCQLFEKRMG